MSAKESTRVEYGKTLAQLGAENPQIVVLDADLSGSTQTHHFAKVFKDRFFNVGIAEQDLMGTAAGLALGGKIPFASTFAMFATGRAWEQIRQTIAYGSLNVKIVASHGGVTVGEDGGSHQAVEDLALMRILPNMVVLVPADGAETRAMTRWAAGYQGPVYMRTGRMAVPLIYDDGYVFELGRGSLLREGQDVTLMGIGIMVQACLDAADLLAQAGIAARVVNMGCLKPLDWELVVDSARQTGALVTAEEHMVTGGLGSAVSEILAEHCPTPLQRIGLKDTFGMSGKPADLLKHYGLTAENIKQAAVQVMARKANPLASPLLDLQAPAWQGGKVYTVKLLNALKTPGSGFQAYRRLVVVLVFVGLTTYFLLPVWAATPSKYDSLRLYTEALFEITQKYVWPKSEETLIYGSLRGMMNSLDPDSSFLTAKEYQAYLQGDKAAPAEAGLVLIVKDGLLTAASVIDDSPASRAGLKPGRPYYQD